MNEMGRAAAPPAVTGGCPCGSRFRSATTPGACPGLIRDCLPVRTAPQATGARIGALVPGEPPRLNLQLAEAPKPAMAGHLQVSPGATSPLRP